VEASAALPEAFRARHPIVFWNAERVLTEQFDADLGILENLRFPGLRGWRRVDPRIANALVK
jgi:hypothetical protein